MDAATQVHDIELRLIDPARNRRRVYGITECRTLFGEPCLRIVWGRLGHRRLRERSEIFSSRAELEARRAQLLERRRRHGYSPTLAARSARVAEASHSPERELVELHGLYLDDTTARALVTRWYEATSELARYLEQSHSEAFDLVDVSTLAAMYVSAA